jgi:hypothetical protein
VGAVDPVTNRPVYIFIQRLGVTGNLALSKEGLFVLSIATVCEIIISFLFCCLIANQEEFIKRLIQAGHREASAHRRNQINYTDMGVFLAYCMVLETRLPDLVLQRQPFNNTKNLCAFLVSFIAMKSEHISSPLLCQIQFLPKFLSPRRCSCEKRRNKKIFTPIQRAWLHGPARQAGPLPNQSPWMLSLNLLSEVERQ